MVTNFIKKEKKASNLVRSFRVEEKSNIKLMRKIAILLDDKMTFCLRYAKVPVKMGFYLLAVI
jgi:hypothetical protein